MWELVTSGEAECTKSWDRSGPDGRCPDQRHCWIDGCRIDCGTNFRLPFRTGLNLRPDDPGTDHTGYGSARNHHACSGNHGSNSRYGNPATGHFDTGNKS